MLDRGDEWTPGMEARSKMANVFFCLRIDEKIIIV